MSTTVLVGYATRYGSTREVAETIAETLRKQGLEVDLQPARKVKSIEAYQWIVLGAPLFMFHWHKDTLRFLSRFQSALNSRPVAVFALGPMTPDKEEEFTGARVQLDKELVKYPWFKPADIQIFGGRLDVAKLRFPFNITLKDLPNSDLRDWDEIKSWTTGLKDIIT